MWHLLVDEADGVRLSADTDEQDCRGDEQSDHVDAGHSFQLQREGDAEGLYA